MISVEGLTFGYQNGASIFQDFNWEVPRHESWVVIGPSGCGKSTLLNILAGLIQSDKGKVVIDQAPITRPRPQTGLIIQDYGLLPWATVRDNARLGLRVRNYYGPDGVHAPREYVRSIDVESWLERLGLLPYANQYPAQISGGQRQRTAIARTLALKPDLLLMDEPFSSLDAPTRESLQHLVLELWRETGITMVTVTHAIEEAALLGQRILLLGHPPNRQTAVIENPHILQPDYRESDEYSILCRDLRARLEVA